MISTFAQLIKCVGVAEINHLADPVVLQIRHTYLRDSEKTVFSFRFC